MKILTLLEELLDIIQDSKVELDSDHKKIVDTIINTQTIDETLIGKMVNELVEVLMSYEDLLSEEHQQHYDDICKCCLNLDALNDFSVGNLVIYDSLPYVVAEIDYEDTTLLLSDNTLDNGFWVEDILKVSKK